MATKEQKMMWQRKSTDKTTSRFNLRYATNTHKDVLEALSASEVPSNYIATLIRYQINHAMISSFEINGIQITPQNIGKYADVINSNSYEISKALNHEKFIASESRMGHDAPFHLILLDYILTSKENVSIIASFVIEKIEATKKRKDVKAMTNKLYVIEEDATTRSATIFLIGVTFSKDEALKLAASAWDKLTTRDKARSGGIYYTEYTVEVKKYESAKDIYDRLLDEDGLTDDKQTNYVMLHKGGDKNE